MRFVYKSRFISAYEAADAKFQRRILQTDQEIKNYLETGIAAMGLRIKKIGPRTFEGRVNDAVRIVWVREKESVSFVLVGSHSDVQNYLRNFR